MIAHIQEKSIIDMKEIIDHIPETDIEMKDNDNERYRRDDRETYADKYGKDERKNDSSNQKGKIWGDFCKTMGNHSWK